MPQGSILGSVMFNIFINNIFDFVKKGDLHNYTDDNILSYGSNSVDDVIETLDRAPDKLRICVFYAIKTSKNACIIRSVYTLRIHTMYCCVSKLSKFGAYLYAVNDNTVVYSRLPETC